MNVSEQDWEQATTLLRVADEVVLVCHVAPDGDALGSMLALGAALRSAGTKVIASWGSEPFEVPANYGFLPALDLLVPAEDVPAAPSLLVTLDSGSVDRLGTLADRVDTADQVLVVDHHSSNTEYGTVHLVDHGAAATAVVVAELLDRLGLPVTQDEAAFRQHCLRLYSGYEPEEITALLTQLRWALQHPDYNFQGLLKGVKTSNEDILFYFAFLVPILEQTAA